MFKIIAGNDLIELQNVNIFARRNATSAHVLNETDLR